MALATPFLRTMEIESRTREPDIPGAIAGGLSIAQGLQQYKANQLELEQAKKQQVTADWLAGVMQGSTDPSTGEFDPGTAIDRLSASGKPEALELANTLSENMYKGQRREIVASSFQEFPNQPEKAAETALQRAGASGDIDLVKQLATMLPKKETKEPKFYEFKVGNQIIGGQAVQNAVVKARHVPGAPDVGLGPGLVPTTVASRDLGARTEQFKYGAALRKEFNKQNKYNAEAESTIQSLKGLLKADKTGYSARAIQTKLAELFSTSSRAIAEVEAWKNRGNLVDRFTGALSQFVKGTPTPDQYKQIDKLVSQYKAEVVDPASRDLKEFYGNIAEKTNVDKDLVFKESASTSQQNVQTDFVSEDDARAAIQAGSIAPGDIITIGGKRVRVK